MSHPNIAMVHCVSPSDWKIKTDFSQLPYFDTQSSTKVTYTEVTHIMKILVVRQVCLDPW